MRKQARSVLMWNEHLTSQHPPLKQAEGRLQCRVVLELADDFAADHDLLARIPEKIADQPDRIRLPELNKHDQIWDRRLQSWIDGVPDTFPAVNMAFRSHLLPSQVEAMTGMADPFRAPLPNSATGTSLDQQPTSLEPIPIGFAETVPLWTRDRKPCG